MVDQQKYQEVKRRVKKISGFYQHLIVYILVNAGLILYNILTNPSDIWFIYPLLGWGIGVVAHALNVFLGEGWVKSWEEKKIRQLLEKESNTDS